jgi:hypothetical protein
MALTDPWAARAAVRARGIYRPVVDRVPQWSGWRSLETPVADQNVGKMSHWSGR